MDDLTILRKSWEKGMKVLNVYKPYDDTVYVTLQEANARYRLHRYFTKGKKWNISVDLNNEQDLKHIERQMLEEL